MKKAKVFSAKVKGTFTQIKAYKKANAVVRFQQLDSNVKTSDIRMIDAQNSHQVPIEDLYPECM